MSRWKKVVIGLLILLNLFIGGITYYAVQVTNDASKMISNIRQTVKRTSLKRESGDKPNIDNAEPFSILLAGIDTGDLGRSDQGRSDSMMVVTINPKQKKSTIVSLDRDILTKIVGYGTNDKLNHAYAFGGVKMSMDTIETLLDIPLDHYVSINMRGLKDLIDAVGGIEVNNKIDFTLDGIHVEKGKQTLDGEKGLAYARMRYEDPEGDVGRQKRQREVVTKILRKAMSINGVGNYRKILKAVEKNMKTDLDWDDMMDIGTNYLSAFDTIKQKQLVGKSQMIDEIYYQILGVNELLDIQNTLKKQLEIPTDETLSNLKETDADTLFYDDSDGKASEDTSQFAPGYDDPNSYDNNGVYGDSSSTDSGYQQNDDTAQNNQGYSDPNQYDQGYTDPNQGYGGATDPNAGVGQQSDVYGQPAAGY
ncbi:LCP family protein [Enterococcus sp.]|uniref:LCP family glycopolymer transferase n=1 Tax=Enterococcus sp. TaxID=35783 RepID=UPI002915642D|nr:LCP family protein [Enterococcus sp.]MDU5335256.1 LCP family protein [Enterococcus sp.]